MRGGVMAALFFGGLVSCVRPVEAPQGAGPGPTDGPPGAGPGAAAPPPDEPADAGLTPLHDQAALGPGPTLEGRVECADCTGSILLRVLPPPPDQGGGELVLVTTATLPAPGPFALKLPPGLGAMVLQAVEDADQNGRPDRGERIGFAPGGPFDGARGASGLTIRIEAGEAPPAGTPAAPGGPPPAAAAP